MYSIWCNDMNNEGWLTIALQLKRGEPPFVTCAGSGSVLMRDRTYKENQKEANRKLRSHRKTDVTSCLEQVATDLISKQW